ncbi:MAG: peptidylprolyl isomerase [Candidatus Acidiferrales bacterium]
MLKSIQQRDLDRNRWVKITMTVILVIICVSMVITLIPGLVGSSFGTNPDAVATVGGQAISLVDLQNKLEQATRGQAMPEVLKGLYAQQVLDQMVFQQALNLEAQRLGISVTDQEETQRIKQILPSAFSGDAWMKDRYANEVQTRTGMSVPEFESVLRDEMLQEKFQRLVTDGITVSPGEIQEEFRRRNEKVQIDYALVKPADLASGIHPTDAQLSAFFAKNSGQYQIPEKRSASYALLDLNTLREQTQIPESDVSAFYNAHLDDYKVENRVHAEHILFKTIGMTDAQITEIHNKAEDVLKQAKHGGNFEDLAKKYSEDDATKPKGGDLGWIVEGQTVPEFQQAAFSLPKGGISDLVKTQYGFHIIKVLDHEQAHTKTLDEVRSQILPALLNQKVNQEASDMSDQMATAVRQSDRQSLADIAKRYHLAQGETQPASVTEAVGDLGTDAELHQELFELRPGELSMPIQTDKGYVIISPKEILPAHQGTLAEVHDKVVADYQQEQSVILARQKALELSKNARGGQNFDAAAKALTLDTKKSDAFPRTGTVGDLGSAKLLDAAFNMSPGQISEPTQIAGNWLVYQVVAHTPANPADIAQQSLDIGQQVMQAKRQAAYQAFQTALQDQLKKEGKIVINNDVLKRLTKSS